MDRRQRHSKRGHKTYTRVVFHGESVRATYFTIVLLYLCVKCDFVTISNYQIPEKSRYKPGHVL